MEIGLSCAIFLKRILFEDLKNNVPRCLTSKYTNTNTQIHKYTNTKIQFLEKSADRHDMCYIFEKLMLRGCQNQCLQGSHMKIHSIVGSKNILILSSCSSRLKSPAGCECSAAMHTKKTMFTMKDS